MRYDEIKVIISAGYLYSDHSPQHTFEKKKTSGRDIDTALQVAPGREHCLVSMNFSRTFREFVKILVRQVLLGDKPATI